MKIEIERPQKLVEVMGQANLIKTLELAAVLAAKVIDIIGEEINFE